MKEEMKETIQEDLNNFKTWGIKYLTWLKKWWVRLILSGLVGLIMLALQEERRHRYSYKVYKDMWEIETVGLLFFFLSYVALYFLVVWLFGKDKNK